MNFEIKKKFYEKALPLADRVKDLKKDHSDKVIGDVTVGNVLNGMRGIPSLLTCTSQLDPYEGIRYRGYTIPEVREKLPKLKEDGEPLPEGLFYLLLMGELPSEKDVEGIRMDWSARGQVPQHVFDAIDALPKTARPMTHFSTAILSMATESLFQKAYRAGVSKADYWDTTYEDVMTLLARLPRIAAYIYRRLYHNGDHIDPDPELDWAGNFAHMLGFDNEEVRRLFRLYLVVHADHEGGNVSAHTTHLVASALSNPYYSYAAGMTGLAGPLHGYANQEVVRWIMQLMDFADTKEPSEDQVKEFVQKTLDGGKVVPGYGHAVLRKTDPRFTAQHDFAMKYFPDDPMVKIVKKLYDIVPSMLDGLGKVKNPWPNVDAHSGALLMHYGITEYNFYTVIFGVSRAIGVLAQLVWDRAYGLPIERPKSFPLEWYEQKAKE